jgi:glycosyltransferase involved in cell wall biosynthesis
MRSATVIYWYDEEHMPNDGGGQRALAWNRALTELGYQTGIQAIHPGPIVGGQPSNVRRVKRLLAPMPKSRTISAPSTDLVVATVPGVFASLMGDSSVRDRVIFDWMDRWSTNSRTMGRSSLLSLAGGELQGAIWSARERRLSRAAIVNTFAGYADLSALGHDADVWLPNPVAGPKTSIERRRSPVTLGFIGNLNYQPNELSLRWFLKRYDTRLREAGLTMLVAGYGSERVRQWGFDVTVLGVVDDLTSFYESIDIAVVPIRHGGGIKVKALEALAFGVPVIGTAHVREGFPPDLGVRAIVDIDDFLEFPRPLDPLDPTEAAREFSAATFNSRVAEVVRQWSEARAH